MTFTANSIFSHFNPLTHYDQSNSNVETFAHKPLNDSFIFFFLPNKVLVPCLHIQNPPQFVSSLALFHLPYFCNIRSKVWPFWVAPHAWCGLYLTYSRLCLHLSLRLACFSGMLKKLWKPICEISNHVPCSISTIFPISSVWKQALPYDISLQHLYVLFT